MRSQDGPWSNRTGILIRQEECAHSQSKGHMRTQGPLASQGEASRETNLLAPCLGLTASRIVRKSFSVV